MSAERSRPALCRFMCRPPFQSRLALTSYTTPSTATQARFPSLPSQSARVLASYSLLSGPVKGFPPRDQCTCPSPSPAFPRNTMYCQAL